MEMGASRGRSSGPQNKSMYMRVRGMFERGDQNQLGFDWDADFERSSMVRAMCATFEGPRMGPEDPCGWDDVRLRLGSPFLQYSIYGYRRKIDEMDEAWSHDGANISMPR